MLGAASSAVRPKEWVILDVLAASGGRQLELELRTEVGVNAGLGSKVTVHSAHNSSDEGTYSGCELWLLALDGVYLEEARTSDAVNHLVLLPGARASVAMSCASAGTYYLQSSSVSRSDMAQHSNAQGEDRYAHVGGWSSKSVQVSLILGLRLKGLSFSLYS